MDWTNLNIIYAKFLPRLIYQSLLVLWLLTLGNDGMVAVLLVAKPFLENNAETVNSNMSQISAMFRETVCILAE